MRLINDAWNDPEVRKPAVRSLSVLLAAATTLLVTASVLLSLTTEPLWDTVLYGLMALGLAVSGMLIAIRHPINPIGWLLSGMGIISAVTEVAEGYGKHPDFAFVGRVEWFSS